MPIVGVLLHIETSQAETVRKTLEAMAQVEPFALDAPGRLGALVETDTVEEAYRLIHYTLHSVPGVLSARPIYAHVGDDL